MNIDLPKGEDETYGLLMATHAGITRILSEKFPDTLIIPAMGNNDAKWHDNPTPLADEHFFYSFLSSIWFDVLPSNNAKLSFE